MKNARLLFLAATLLILSAAPGLRAATKPNIVIIYADDLGYGDTGCYGATEVRTPNVDRLAKEGLRFTDAHAAAATCTPSRYALMTGEYAWRKAGTGVLPGNAALIIAPGRATLPSVLQKAGYTTGVVGKWHLGLGPQGGPDWNGKIKPGPRELGFDSSFIIPATGDRVPCVFVENGRVANLDPHDPIAVSYKDKIGDDPTGKEHPELLKMKFANGHDQTIVNGISRIGYMTGGKAARWTDEDIADTLTHKATAFIEQHKDAPFFLYFATHDIHVPRVPNARFAGKTKLGPRGDVIEQFDACVGEILATLDRLKLADNTLVIFSSDNGPVLNDGYKDDAVEKLDGHKPAGPLRGGKYSSWEGGTRMPFVVRWPARVKPGVSDALICQVDLLASLAALSGQTLAAADAPDSFNILPALLGESKTGRTTLVEQGGPLAVREGNWKLIAKSPGYHLKKTEGKDKVPRDLGNSADEQLFNLTDDIAEAKNVATEHPDKVAELTTLLGKAKEAGSTRP